MGFPDKVYAPKTEKQARLAFYVERIENIPTLPTIAFSVLRKTEQQDYDIDELVDLILMDQVLAAKTLRIVNSAFMGLSRQVQTLRQALVVLGAREIRNLVLATSLLQLLDDSKNNSLVQSFWEHSFACGIFSIMLAKNIGYRNTERAYLAGLLHDIGEVILIANFPNEVNDIVDIVPQYNWDFNKAEAEVLGISHVDFGPWLLERWNIGGDIAHVVARHHEPENALVDPPLVAIVNMADLYCRSRGLYMGSRFNVKIDLENQIAWKIMDKKYPIYGGFEPKFHLEFLDSNLKDVQDAIKTVFK